jgi:hypothetical protein
VDRNEENWRITVPQGRPDQRRIVPIDNALAFTPTDEIDLAANLPGRGMFLDLVLSNVERGRLTPDHLRSEYRRLTERWAQAPDSPDLLVLGPTRSRQVAETLRARAGMLADREVEHLELLTEPAGRGWLHRRAQLGRALEDLLSAFRSPTPPGRDRERHPDPPPRTPPGGPPGSSGGRRPPDPPQGRPPPRLRWRPRQPGPERGRDRGWER